MSRSNLKAFASRLLGILPGLPTPWIVASAFFMENLDANIIVTALPAIAGDFGVSAADASIGITAYVLMLAVMLPTSGWISDRFGARNVFCAAIVVFTLTSVWCAVSHGLVEFTMARMLQGAAGALMSPVGRILVLGSTDKRGLMQAWATITWPGLIAPVIAPPLGGLITTYSSWHWIFLLNVPLGVAGMLLALRSLPNRREAVRKPFDWRGFAFGAVALGCLVYGLDLVGPDRTAWPLSVVILCAAAAFGVLAVRHARRHPHALFDLDLLRIQTFAVPTLLGGMLTRLAISGTPFLLPLMFQLGFGLSAFDSGMLILVHMGGNLVMKAGTTAILRTFGFRPVLLANAVLVALSIGAFAFVSPQTPWPLLIALLFFSGAVRSMQFTSLNTLTFADVPPDRRSSATMFASVLQQMPWSVGVAVAAMALSLSEGDAGPTLAAFGPAFLMLSAVSIAALPFLWTLARDAGAEVSARAEVA